MFAPKLLLSGAAALYVAANAALAVMALAAWVVVSRDHECLTMEARVAQTVPPIGEHILAGAVFCGGVRWVVYAFVFGVSFVNAASFAFAAAGAAVASGRTAVHRSASVSLAVWAAVLAVGWAPPFTFGPAGAFVLDTTLFNHLPARAVIIWTHVTAFIAFALALWSPPPHEPVVVADKTPLSA